MRFRSLFENATIAFVASCKSPAKRLFMRLVALWRPFSGARSKQSPSNEPVKRKKDEIEKLWLEGPDLDSYEETLRRLRAEILGDDWLMSYCLFVAARDAIEKGEDAYWQLLDHCDCDLVERLKVDCGDDPRPSSKNCFT
jgi:hypothetical protein